MARGKARRFRRAHPALRPGAIIVVALVFSSAVAGGATLQGDCNGDASVSIGEVVRCANIFTAEQALSECRACDANRNHVVSIGEIVGAANCFASPQAPGCRAVAPPSNCCSAHDGPGCEDAVCQSCVCALDPDQFCCLVFWDGLCVDVANFGCPNECACEPQ